MLYKRNIFSITTSEVNRNMINSRKAISPVVSTALILVVAVVSVVGFGTWFNFFSSSTFVDIEQKSSYNRIDVQGIISDTLYLKSSTATDLEILKIVNKSGGVVCDISNTDNTNFQGDTRLLFNFDDGNATDYSGYGNNGTLNGAVDCSVEGVLGQGCEFNGFSSFINADMSETNSTFTISLWMKPKDDIPNDSFAAVIRRSNAIGEGFYFRYDNLTPTISFYTGNVSHYNRIDSNTVSGDSWTHFGLVYDYEYSKIYIYQDGNLVDSTGTNFDSIYYSLSNITIGAHSSNSEDFFNGTIDEVGIYSKALSSEEIKVLYDARKSLMYEEIFGTGIKSIDVSSCNLVNGEKYSVIGFSNDNSFQVDVLAK